MVCHWGGPWATLSHAFVLRSGQHIRQRPGLHRVLGLTEQPAERGAGLPGRCHAICGPVHMQPPCEPGGWVRLAVQPALGGVLPAAHHGESAHPLGPEPLSPLPGVCDWPVISSWLCRSRSWGSILAGHCGAAGWSSLGQTLEGPPDGKTEDSPVFAQLQ